VWLTDRPIYKSFLRHHCVVLYTVYVYVRMAPVRSQHVTPRCTLCNSRPRLLPRLTLPILTPLKLACSLLRPRCCCCYFCCRPAAVGTPCQRRHNGWLHAETAGDYKRRRRIVTNRIQFAYRSARSIFSWADGCSLFNLLQGHECVAWCACLPPGLRRRGKCVRTTDLPGVALECGATENWTRDILNHKWRTH